MLVLLLHLYDALIKTVFWISSRAGSFIITEVALEIFEHPKPDSSQLTVFLRSQFDSTLLLTFPKAGKGI
ncbi:MAG: hypothetical protein LC768_09990 [Acidobacteria bacterium]|nr:hypothetical protein [Acidobacteriota bacterium]MCA1638648.1 hypothetical protein [Acidobacteriota bacterium]